MISGRRSTARRKSRKHYMPLRPSCLPALHVMLVGRLHVFDLSTQGPLAFPSAVR